jgi:hypothetical protein
MKTLKLISLVALSATALAACHPNDGAAGGDNRLCTAFPETTTANANGNAAASLGVATANPSDPAAVLDDCLHRWGYALALGRDNADVVGAAVVAACSPALSHWNQQVLANPQTAPSAGAQGGDGQSAPSLLTGEPTTPLAEHYVYAQSRALFYVAQARAGKCAPPQSVTPANGAR